MRKLIRGLYVALGFTLSGALGGLALSAGMTPFTGPGGANPINNPSVLSDFVNFFYQMNTYLNFGQANSAAQPLPIGRVFHFVGPITDLATSQGVTIETYTIPAGSFETGGRAVRIHATFHTSTNFNSRSLACGVAAQSVTMTIATTSKQGSGTCDFIVTQGGTANTQMASGTIIFSTTSATTANIAQLLPTTSSSFTSANAQSAWFATSDPTAAGDILLDDFEVFYDS